MSGACDDKVKVYTQIVNELQASENRNDEFMRILLERSEKLDLMKLNEKEYHLDMKNIESRLDAFDRYNKENHTHYIQVENFMEKFLPLKIQKQIGKNFMAVFGGKKSTLEKYRDYEEQFLKESNKIILADEGQPTLLGNVHKEFLSLLSGALVVNVTDRNEKVSARGKARASDTSVVPTDRIVAKDTNGEDVYISLRDYIIKNEDQFREFAEPSAKPSIQINFKADKLDSKQASSARHQSPHNNLTPLTNDYESMARQVPEKSASGRLMPALDLERVMINRRMQFQEFLRMYTALNVDHARNVSSRSRSRGGVTPSKSQQAKGSQHQKSRNKLQNFSQAALIVDNNIPPASRGHSDKSRCGK